MAKGIGQEVKHKEAAQSSACHSNRIRLAFWISGYHVILLRIRFKVSQIIIFVCHKQMNLNFRTVQPLFLLGLIAFYSNGEDKIETAYLYAAGVIACSALNVMVIHPYMLGTMHVGMKMRVAMCSMIYRKALRLSKTALGNTTAGQVVNLISNDVGRLDLATIFVHYLWVGPLETCLITYLMYREVGILQNFY